MPNWLGVILCFSSFIPGMAVAVVTCRLLLRLAERGRGELAPEGDRLRWDVLAAFPWHRRPQPAFCHISIIYFQTAMSQERAFIENLKAQAVSSLTCAGVTPDYLIGSAYRSLRSKMEGLPDGYAVMPLGYVQVEVSFPCSDWQPFIVGHVLKHAVAAALGMTASAGSGPPLEHRHYLYVRGRREDGAPLELTFDWYRPEDQEYEEAQFLVHFVEAMLEQVQLEF